MILTKEYLVDKIYYLLIFLALYCSHDTLLFGTNADNLFITFRKIVPFLLIFGLVAIGRLKVINLKDLIIVGIFIVLPFFSALVNSEAFDNYIYRATIMLCAAVFVWTSKEKEFFVNLNSIIYFLSVWSIITCVIANLLPTVISVFPIIRNTAGANYNFMLFSSVAESKLYGFVRNMSIFREPGVFAVFLTLAFVIELIMMPKVRTKYMVVYTIAMLSTFSTAGYIILACIYVYMILSSRNFRYKYVIAMIIVVATIFITQFTDLLSAEGALFGKFTEGVGNYGSWLSRLSGLTGNVQIALRNPLFGIGRYTLYGTVLATSGRYVITDNTNTMMINLAAYGLPFGIISFYGLWKFVRLHQNKILSALFVVVILFMALSNEDMGQNIVYYVIIFTGIASHKDRV